MMAEHKHPIVFVSNRHSDCSECKEPIGKGALITWHKNDVICLVCADIDHLQYLPSGNVCVTRRATKHSALVYVVLKRSSARKRNERQGLLVEATAIEMAEQACLADSDFRKRRREKAEQRRNGLDQEFIKKFSIAVRQFYPNCPDGRELEIADHACEKYSGRVGRSQSAKDLSESAVDLAVVAHVRHRETRYDSLLMAGWDRRNARDQIRDDIDDVMASWR